MFSNFVDQLRGLFGQTKMRIIMIGLDNAGKTTILFQLKLSKPVTTFPTMGFNVETIQHKNVSLVMWDVGGQDKIRHLWRTYSASSQGIIFVVDCADPQRIPEAKTELFNILQEETLKDVPLLIFCNKQDIVGSTDINELKEKLSLSQITDRNWYMQKTVATKGEGIKEGLDWLVDQLRSASFFSK